VAFDIVCIVERVPKLSAAYKAEHPVVDWDEFAALRTRTEPEFAKIDAAAEWEAVTTLLPPIAAALDALLPAGAPWNGTAPEAAGLAEAGPAAVRDSAQPVPTPLPIPRDELRALCQKLRVTRLRLFGSALRGDFGPESDVDLLVEYEPGTNHPWGGVSLHEEFSPLFAGRKVELGDPEHLSPYVRDGILAEAVEIYPVDRRPTEKVK
jgi:predicted nucleotidyltransferase